MRIRRTIRQYMELFRNPRALFSGGPDDTGVEVVLFPNGEREIWIKGTDGKGLRLRASEGPYGMGLQIDTFAGTTALTVMTDAASDSHLTARHISLCQYNNDAKAQAFREAYLSGQLGALDRFHAEWR